jgi:hypothetical protein
MSQELCIKALQKMPVSFSSTRFSKQLKKFNVDPSFINNGVMNKFLLINCNQEGIRSWNKKVEKLPATDLQITFVKELETDLQKAIQIVKNSGQYKVYKLQQEWKEI